MSKRKNEGEINEKLKEQNQELNVNDPSGAAAGVNIRNGPCSPAIFKLNAICFDDLFEWLSLTDLNSLSQTCKRMQQLTGLYFQENFKKRKIICGEKRNIYFGRRRKPIQMTGLIKFVQNIEFNCHHNEAHFQYISENCDSLCEISFNSVKITKSIINCIKDKLDNIETIDWNNMSLLIRLNADLLQFCPKLKTLRLHYCDQNEWMYHEYPKLENFTIYWADPNLTQNFDVFLRKNKQLQCFKTTHCFLRNNWNAIVKSELKLNVLIISQYVSDGFDSYDDLCSLVNQLYDHGFYKRLRLELCKEISSINQIMTLPGLEELSVYFGQSFIKLPTIDGLKELIIHFMDDHNINFEVIIKSLPNLRKVCFMTHPSTKQLLPFMRRLPKLKELGIYSPSRRGLQIELSALNEERKKLFGACKLVILVREDVYLETKMATKNLYVIHNLIEIKRIDSTNMRYPSYTQNPNTFDYY